ASRPDRTLVRVLLPEPLGPMMAWTSPGRMVRFRPLRISLSSIFAFRFLISSMFDPHRVYVGLCWPQNPMVLITWPPLCCGLALLCSCFSYTSAGVRGAPGLTNGTFQADFQQLGCFHRKLHRQLFEYFLTKTVHDHGD